VSTPIVKPPTLERPRPLPTRYVTKPNSNGNDSAVARGPHDEFKPRLLFPSEGSSVRRNELVFRWEPAADAVFYKVRLVTMDGSLIREIETKEPTLKLGDDVELRDNAKYYVTVVAHRSDGLQTESVIVGFRLIKD